VELAAGLARVERRLVRRRALRRSAVAMLGALAVAGAVALAGDTAAEPELLTRADGLPLTFATDERVELSDGSAITLDPNSALSVVEQRPGLITLRLDGGSARFDIRPGGPRRFLIHAGPVRVEVLGTSFTVSRRSSYASVAVHQGVVSITTAQETRRLYAGERFEVGAPPSGAAPPPSNRTRIEEDERAFEPPRAELDVSTSETAPSAPVVRRARRRDPGAGDVARAPTVDLRALLARADRARRDGRVDDALAALWAIVDTHPQSSEASSAAITAARIEQQRGRYESAIAAYRRALTLAPSPALTELCYESLVACHLALSDRAAAELTATEYHRRFASGTRAEAIDAMLRAPR
jgi:transmembrane sensor